MGSAGSASGKTRPAFGGSAIDAYARQYSGRLLHRDRRLPEGALLLHHDIAVGPPGADLERKTLVFGDGRVFSVATWGARYPDEIPFPHAPVGRLTEAFVARLARAVNEALPTDASSIVTSAEFVFDGGYDVLLAHIDGEERERLFVNSPPPAVLLLRAPEWIS